MTYDPMKHHRRSIRLRGYDYGSEGLYFVTVCTYKRLSLFGKIENGEMHLTDIGQMVADTFNTLSEKYPQVTLGDFVVMPNHFHCILRIDDFGNGVTGGADWGQADPAPTVTLGQMVGYFKYVTTQRAGLSHLLWQRNYYEHIIRDCHDYEKIADYIRTNPQRWQSDCLFPSPDTTPL